MHTFPKRAIPILVLAVLALGAGAYYLLQTASTSKGLVVSGTIEAYDVRVGAEKGGRVDAVYASEGEHVKAGQLLVEVHNAGTVKSPISGIVTERLIEPGEVVGTGANLMVIADLDQLTLTVFVPEDRYGQIKIGEAYPVTVDSFPGQFFNGTVVRIADRAEFTPRNVQTIDNRKTTVYAIKMALQASNGQLKPGMPADAHFEYGQP